MKILLLAGCGSGQGHGLYWLEVVGPVECSDSGGLFAPLFLRSCLSRALLHAPAHGKA